MHKGKQLNFQVTSLRTFAGCVGKSRRSIIRFYRLQLTLLAVLLGAHCEFFSHSVNAQSIAPIKMSVEHAEYLPEENTVTPGKPFLKTMMPMTELFTWYQVPDWLAGKWHREVEFSIGQGTDGRPISTMRKSKADVVYGHQLDKQGDTWSFIQVPFTQTIDSGPYIYYKLTKTFEPSILENHHFVIRTTSDDVKVLKNTGKIQEVFRREEIHELKAGPGDSKVSALISIRQFDMKGHPTLTAGAQYELDKTGPFTEVRYWTKGEDLLADLNSWLKMHDKASVMRDMDE
jgi:hypothetical protein